MCHPGEVAASPELLTQEWESGQSPHPGGSRSLNANLSRFMCLFNLVHTEGMVLIYVAYPIATGMDIVLSALVVSCGSTG